ncbi:MAG: type II toxin-antitoxin system RelE family toxin [Actinomycetota bacterium]
MLYLKKEYEKIADVISLLEFNPRPPQVKKLGGFKVGLWRIRVGRFRIIYSIDDKSRLITIVRVAKRNEDTYKNL